jgi:tetratricopeptide (TPR) repeat protein
MQRTYRAFGRTTLGAAVLALCAANGLAQAQSGTTDSPSPIEQPVEAKSLLGQPLLRPVFSPEQAAKLQRDLEAAEAALAADPASPDNLIWVGRRQAYLGRYRDAVVSFTLGVERFPDDARFLRHRGHRWITLREFDKAVDDLVAAAKLVEGREDEIEPDGQPNAAGIPTSTLHTNIWYHLGLAHFLRGDFEAASAAYSNCHAACTNNDMLYATLAWLYLALRRASRTEAATVLLEQESLQGQLLENEDYRDCLLLYRGELTVEGFLAAQGTADDRPLADATRGFALAQFLWLQGKTDEATRQLETVNTGSQWAAFGFIAAEAELARLRAVDSGK